MENNTINGFIEALKNDAGYDFIANNYYKMSKDDLKGIILELLYELHLMQEYNENFSINRVIEELKERYAD